LAIEACDSLRSTGRVLKILTGRLSEHVSADVTGDLVLQIGDLVEQLRNDVLSKVVLRLLLVKPGEVFRLCVLQLLVPSVVEGSGVALLVDEALTFSQGLLKLDLLLAEILDAVNLPVLLEFRCISLALVFLSLLSLRLLYEGLPLFHLALNGIELSLTFLFHSTAESVETLLVLLSQLRHNLLCTHLVVPIKVLLMVNALASRLLLNELSLKVSHLVELGLLLGIGFLDLGLLRLHPGKLFCVLLLELLSELFHVLAILFSHLSVENSHETVRQVLLEDLLLLVDLLVLEVGDVLHLTVLAAHLHVTLDLAFLSHVVVLDLEELFVELVVDIFLLLLEFGELGRLVRPADDGVDTAFAVSCVLT